MGVSSRVLPLIVISQFFCTSLWFAGNAVMPGLIASMGLTEGDIGVVTSAVQLGFIVGTLCFALLAIPDRFNPSSVFFISSILGSLFNLVIIIEGIDKPSLLLFRFLTGFFLAGIYPVGMKIAADYFEEGLGKALSLLVGALVLGKALPHLIASLGSDLEWKFVMIGTSSLAVLGGGLIQFLVPAGPYRRPSQKIRLNSIIHVFKIPAFRQASFGYFGHMWELYTFWAFVPIILRFGYPNLEASAISLYSFMVIGIGSIACAFGGFLSVNQGVKKVATAALFLSGICCLISPAIFSFAPNLLLIFLLFWGAVVIADSPLFSALVALHADPEIKGTALTIVTSIGFALTIFSIQLIVLLIASGVTTKYLFLALIPGPLFGVMSLLKRD